jgi:hypothetical protein
MVMVSAPPSGLRVAMITAVAAIGSVFVNAVIVWIAKAANPSLQDYSHFRLWDYGTLSVVGVAGAGVAWYIASRYLATPRVVFFRVAIAVTLVLWAPDVWILVKHEPTRAVLFLALMHLTVALITYNLLVFAAPVAVRESAAAAEPTPRSGHVGGLEGEAEPPRVPRGVWVALMVAVGVEFFAGLLGMLYVPFNRPDGWLVHRGEAIYLMHSLLGGVLAVAALAVVFHVLRQSKSHRIDRVAAISGLCGMFVGALGGAMCVFHPLRLLGMALMFVGVSVAFFGYLIPMIDETPSVAPSTSSPSTS